MAFRPMSHEEYQRAIDQLGLTQVDAGHFFELTDRTSRNYSSGFRKVPKAIAIALRLMIRDEIDPDEIDDDLILPIV